MKKLGFFLGLLLRSLPLASNDSESMESAGVLCGESVLPVGVYVETDSRCGGSRFLYPSLLSCCQPEGEFSSANWGGNQRERTVIIWLLKHLDEIKIVLLKSLIFKSTRFAVASVYVN